MLRAAPPTTAPAHGLVVNTNEVSRNDTIHRPAASGAAEPGAPGVRNDPAALR